MRQVIGDVFGAPEQYRLAERPIPSLAANEVRIRVCAAALGYADILAAGGKHQLKPPLPFTPGTEFSGIVDAVSTEVADIAVGDRVIGISRKGALAEQIIVPASAVRRKPATLSFEEAACLRVDYLTAFHALVDRAGLAAGERLLVLGAAGGVGRAAVQIGKAFGAHVIAGASTDAKRACAMEQGADATIDYTRADWREAFRGSGSVDVVFDPVGGAVFDPAFRSLGWKGVIW